MRLLVSRLSKTANLDLLAVSLDVEEEADDERRVVLEVELSTGQSDLE
jgi:hypothetical protein